MKTEPADKAGVAAHQDQKVEIVNQFLQGADKIFYRKIKVDKTADRKRNKVQDQCIIIRIIIDKFYIHQN